jgi:hypothetical protein
LDYNLITTSTKTQAPFPAFDNAYPNDLAQQS